MIARRLLAPPPAGARDADVVVVGSGVAGVTTVLAIRTARCPTARILLATKSVLDDGSTRWAQGGVAAALGPGDSPEQHLDDTLTAGAGRVRRRGGARPGHRGPGRGAPADRHGRRVRPRAVRAAVPDQGRRAPAPPDRACRRRRDRRGDLPRAARRAGRGRRSAKGTGIEVIEHALAIDLLLTPDGRAAGITLHVLGEGQQDGVGAVHARGGRAGHRRIRPGLLRDHESAGVHRRRGCARAAGRGGRRRTWSSSSSTRRCCGSGRTRAAASR